MAVFVGRDTAALGITRATGGWSNSFGKIKSIRIHCSCLILDKNAFFGGQIQNQIHHFEGKKQILLTFPDNDRDRVAALQLPLVGDRQGELVRSDLEARRCGNGAVCIFNLHAVGTPGGGADGGREREDATVQR